MPPELAPSLQAAIGTRFRVRQELGGGGMSSTYIVDEVALGRPVVLKVLPPHLADGVSAERFEREIQVAARLQHAFLVPLLSAGVVDGTPWYTMPLVQGESLRARLTREGAMPATAVARVLRDVAEALAYAHSQGVIHRDIKPDNVLLSGSHALVTDFGIAKALQASSPGRPAMTGEGMAIGTPAYMAPEQAAGDPNTDARADLYALGAMGFEMLVGRPMFGDRNPAQMLVAHAVETPPSLASTAPSTPSDLAKLIERLLAKHPNDRPTRAQDVADALGAMLSRWSTADGSTVQTRVSAARAFSLWGAAFVGVAGAAWVAVRWLPVPEWTFPAAVVVMLAGLPVIVAAVWLHRPAQPVDATPSVASTTTMGRLQAVARPHLNARRALRMGGIVVGALALVAAAWTASRQLGIGPAATLRSRGVVAATDRVLVGDLVSPPQDTTLGRVVGVLLRTEISRSPSVLLLTAQQRALLLRTMSRPATTLVTGDVEHEVALRAKAKVHIGGSVTQLGTSYVLQATIVETATGRELKSFRERAASADAIIGAVDRLGREIRDELGASLREVRSAPPLYSVLSPSLEALRLYTTGTQRAVDGDFVGAIARLEGAVAADTEFAEGYRRLASYYTNVGNEGRAVWAAEQAFKYRDRFGANAKRFVEGTYYSRATRDFDAQKAISAYAAFAEEAPRSSAGWNNLALEYLITRENDNALEAFKRSVAIDTTSTFAPHNILRAYWSAGKANEGRQYFATQLQRWQPLALATAVDGATMQSADFDIAGATTTLEKALAKAKEKNQPLDRLIPVLSSAYAAQGRFSASGDVFRQSTLPGAGAAPGPSAAVLVTVAAEAGPLQHPERARALLDSVTAIQPPANASAVDYPWLNVAELYASAGSPAKAAQFLQGFERSASAGQRAFYASELGLAKGWIALAEKKYDAAIAAFRSADAGDCLTCALPPLGHAYDLAGKPDSAIAVLERYLATREFDRLARTDRKYLAGAYKRLGELYEERGDSKKALANYDRFIDLWKNADAPLQSVVKEVRRKADVLRARTG